MLAKQSKRRMMMRKRKNGRMSRLNSQGYDVDDEDMDEMKLYNNHDDNFDVVDDDDDDHDYDESVDRSVESDYNDQGKFSSLVLLDEIGTG